MSRLSLLFSVLLFAACASNTATEDPAVVPGVSGTETVASEPDTPETSTPQDALDLPPLDEEAVASLFPVEAVRAVVAYDRAFRAVASSDELKAVYDQARALEQTLLGPMGDTEWDNLMAFMEADLGMPGLSPSCVAECTMPSLAIAIDDWKLAAEHVGDEGSMEFFDLLASVYPSAYIAEGQLGGWPSYVEQTWDYGGYSVLGSGAHADLLRQFASADGGVFAVELQALREGLARDVLETTCVGPSAEDAQAELVRIADALTLPDAGPSLEVRIDAFEEPNAAGIQTGCAVPDATCACIGG
ncbi:MAG: hypothetical protein AAGK21_00660 [Bacteroidota bacterium]